MSQLCLQRLKERFGEAIVRVHSFRGDDTAVILPEAWRDVALFVRDEPELAMDHFIDLTAVDYLGHEPRFEVVLHIRSSKRLFRLRLKAGLPETDPAIDSLTPIWTGAGWFEREAFDMFGIRFKGHPDLRRILLYEEFVGHPLRKDYPINKRQPRIPLRHPEECRKRFQS